MCSSSSSRWGQDAPHRRSRIRRSTPEGPRGLRRRRPPDRVLGRGPRHDVPPGAERLIEVLKEHIRPAGRRGYHDLAVKTVASGSSIELAGET